MSLTIPDRRVNSRPSFIPGRHLVRAIAGAIQQMSNNHMVPMQVDNFDNAGYSGKRPPAYSPGSGRKRSVNRNLFGKKIGKVTLANQGGNGASIRQKKRKGKKKVSFKKKIKKRITALEKRTGNYGVHIFKSSATVQASALTNKYGLAEANLVSAASIEQMLDSLPVANIPTPATATTYNATTVGIPTKYRVSCYATVTMRNNYLYPLEMDCYILSPKMNTSIGPQTAITNGLTLESAATALSTLGTAAYWWYPSHSKEFNQFYKIEKHHTQKLNSGDEMTMNYSGNFQYDHKFVDKTTETYLKRFSRIFLIRIRGCIAHESATPANIGYSTAKIDCIVDRTFTIKYPAIMSSRTIEDVNGVTDLTTAIVGVSSAEVENAL